MTLNKLNRIASACAVAATTALAAGGAQAQISGDVIRIGIITDMSGLYSDCLLYTSPSPRDS